MNTNVKKLLLIFGGGFLLFWAFKKIKPIDVKKKTNKKTDSNASADGNSEEKTKNAKICMKAFIEAKKAGDMHSYNELMGAKEDVEE